MSSFELKIETDNAAFDDTPATEIARILRELADDLESGAASDNPQTLRDYNGNAVGYAEVNKGEGWWNE